MSEYITTYTGKHFFPLEPEADLIVIEDIAHALSLICRGNGHVKMFYSVGEHCISCAREALHRGYTKSLALACLLHDAGECYLSDVPRPFKKTLPLYQYREDQLLDLIYEKFIGRRLTREEAERLREIDDALLWYDLRDLLGENPGGEAPFLHVETKRSPRSFQEVEEEYLKLFFQLKM